MLKPSAHRLTTYVELMQNYTFPVHRKSKPIVNIPLFIYLFIYLFI
jgi:hypothetical protein